MMPKRFQKWVTFAKERNMGIDFNPTFFAHPMVKDNLTLSSPDENIRTYWVNHGKACLKIAEYFASETCVPFQKDFRIFSVSRPGVLIQLDFVCTIYPHTGLGLGFTVLFMQ